MTADRFGGFEDATSPSTRPYTIAPSDTAELPELPKAIYVGTGGDVTLRGAGAKVDVTFANVPSGTVLDVRASHVRVTGTTADDLVALA